MIDYIFFVFWNRRFCLSRPKPPNTFNDRLPSTIEASKASACSGLPERAAGVPLVLSQGHFRFLGCQLHHVQRGEMFFLGLDGQVGERSRGVFWMFFKGPRGTHTSPLFCLR